MRNLSASASAAVLALVLTQGAFALGAREGEGAKESATAYDLEFDSANYVSMSADVDGATVSYRAYEGIVYVREPVDAKYQSLNFYVPEAYYRGGSIDGWKAESAPIFFPNGVGGYMPAEPGKPGAGRDGQPNAALVALARGYVVAAPGARGRTTQDESGAYVGKAPACIVDLKAAVRYLRHNDAAMPGDAERIVSNGTSAGGGLSVLLGASGGIDDYEPYLRALGAADERDDVFAVSSYCPITNLENADAAYEWQLVGVNDYRKMLITQMIDYRVERKEIAGTLSAGEIAVSEELAALFPGYLNGLGLRAADGAELILDADGNGPFKDYVKSFVVASAQAALDSGIDLSSHPWITVDGGKVVDLDFPAYLLHAGRMKLPPAFDALDLSSGENSLFGTSTEDARHFTAYSAARSASPGSGPADPALVRMMNPMSYIGAGGAKSAAYWRIRHGTMDKDTSLAVSVILATGLRSEGYSVDFALPWDRPHSGDYDLPELFAWIDGIAR